jgi:hypothetical protein
MDRRMLAIGVVATALAVGCGDSNDASDRAIQAPEGVETEATVPPNSGRIGDQVPVEGNARSDAAQLTGANPRREAKGTDRSDAAQRSQSTQKVLAP